MHRRGLTAVRLDGQAFCCCPAQGALAQSACIMRLQCTAAARLNGKQSNDLPDGSKVTSGLTALEAVHLTADIQVGDLMPCNTCSKAFYLLGPMCGEWLR